MNPNIFVNLYDVIDKEQVEKSSCISIKKYPDGRIEIEYLSDGEWLE